MGSLVGKYDLVEAYHFVDAAKTIKPVLDGVPLLLPGVYFKVAWN